MVPQHRKAAWRFGGILSGIGDIGGEVIVSSGAVLSPGSSPGLLSTGSLALETGSTYIVEIEGEVLGTSYDSVSVTGTVDLNNATLDVRFDAQLPDVTPNDGYEFIVINNDGTDPIVGRFAGLPDGAQVTAVFAGGGKNWPHLVLRR
jgi:hypothetical protein